jgi:hypothetical protein
VNKETIEKAKEILKVGEMHDPTGSFQPAKEVMDTISELLEIIDKQGWQPVETAPKDETLFRLRDKTKPHETFEACIFRDCESYEMPEEYYVLQNMTFDEPVDDSWDNYEWQPLPLLPNKET